MSVSKNNELGAARQSQRDESQTDSEASNMIPTTDLAVAEAMEQYLILLESKQPIDRDKFLARFPHIAERLSDAMDSLEFVNRLANGHSVADPTPKESTPSAIERPESAEELGDFRIIREIGRGGMGVVYEAEQRSLGRHVALKVMPFASLLDPRQIERFRNETRAAAMLRHPNIVSIHSIGCERGVHYYAMDLIDGCSLADVVAKLSASDPLADAVMGNLDTSTSAQPPVDETQPIAKLSTEHSSDQQSYFRTVATLGVQAAEALHFAHQSGVVHRDIKPSNLLLDRTGQVHVADFGLARIQTDDSLTMTGDLVGTLRYMSPEQVEGHVADERADIYSLGSTLFELATGRPVYTEQNRSQLIRAILDTPVPSARRLQPGIPTDLVTILAKCLEKNPAARYRNAKECADDLQRFLNHRSIKAKPANSVMRLRQFTRRNPVLAGTLTATFVAMTLLTAVTSLLAWNYSTQSIAEATRLEESRITSRLQRISLYALDMRAAKELADERSLMALQDVLLKWVPNDGDEDLRDFEWFHLWQYCEDPAVIHTFNHELPVEQIEFLDDSEIVVSGFPRRAKILKIHAKPGDKPRDYLNSPKEMMDTMLVDRTRNRLFTSDGGGNIKIWDPVAATELQHIEPQGIGLAENGVDTLSLSSDGRLLAVGVGSGMAPRGIVRVVDLTDERTVVELEQPSWGLAVFDGNDQLVVAGGKNDRLLIYDPIEGDLVRSFPIRASGTRRMTMSPDMRLLALGTYTDSGPHRSHRIEIWDAATWNRLWSVNVSDPISALAFSDDGKMLSCGDYDGTLWSVEVHDTGRRFKLLSPKKLHSQSINGIALSPNRSMLATASDDSSATVWDMERLYRTSTMAVSSPLQEAARIGSSFVDERDLVATPTIKGLTIWNASTGKTERELSVSGQHDSIFFDSIPAKGLIGFTTAYWPPPTTAEGKTSIVGFWHTITGKQYIIDGLPPMGKSVTSCSFSPDAKFFGVCTHTNGVLIVDVSARRVLHELVDLPGKTLRFSRDSKTLTVGTNDGWTHILSVPDFEVTASVNPEDRLVDSTDRSPDGRYDATVGFERCIKIYDRLTGETKQLPGSTESFPCLVRFSPNGKRILTASLDGKIRLWITETGDQVMSWDEKANCWPAGGFSPNGESIVISGYGYAKAYHARSQKTLRGLSSSTLRTNACQNISDL